MDYTCKLLKIGQIAGMYYTVGKSDTVVVYGIGAPIPPDSGHLADAPVLLKFGVDIFVPDYLGYARSDGTFTPKNCIQTFLRLYKAFKNGCLAKNRYEDIELTLQYNRIIFIGRSFGGTYMPLLPRFNPEIQEIGIIYPVVDNKSQGSIKGEETNETFLETMKEDGYYHLYRGILNNVWKNHLENKDDLSPMNNMQYLKHAKLFIGHGKQDKCVHFSKSVNYYQQLIHNFPDQASQFKLKLYPGDHSSQTSVSAVPDFMKWLGLKPTA